MRSVLGCCLSLLLLPLVGWADSFEDAQKAFNEKQFKQAIKLLDEHLKVKSDDAKAYLLRGRAHANTQNVPQAIADATKSIELDPKTAGAYRYRGQWYARDAKTRDKALADFGKAIDLEPKVHWHRLDRGQLYLKGTNKPEYDKAFADFEVAVKLNAKSANAYVGRGQAVMGKGAELGTFRRGDTVYTSVIGYQPSALQTALPDFTKAIELNPKLVEARRQRAECYLHLHEEAKELADRKELAVLDKTDAQNFNRLGWILATTGDDKMRDPKASVTAAKRAVELTKEKDAYILDTLAAAHAAAGEFKEAAAAQQRVIEMLKVPPGSPFHERLELYKQNKPYREGRKSSK